jgi:hypothetical protein
MGNLDSKEIEWFGNTLQDKFGVIFNPNEISYEAVELGLDEVDDFYVPTELFGEVPVSLLYETMLFDDEQENLWVGAVAFYPNTSNWCIQVITKNGDVVLRKLLPFVE